MRNICLLWTAALLSNCYIRADEVYFQLLDKNQIDDKPNFYYIINFPNNSISSGDETSGTAKRSSEDNLNTTGESPVFREHEPTSKEKLADYDKVRDFPDVSLTSTIEERDMEETAAWTPPAEDDIFKGILDDFFENSSNIIRVTVEIPISDNDEYYKPVATYSNSNAKSWLKGFGIVGAFIAAAYGAYLKINRKREMADANTDVTATVILIVPKSEKV